MADQRLQDILRIPGKLSFNPTDLSSAYPHGGTALGNIHKMKVMPMKVLTPIRGEEFGSEIIDYVDCGDSWILSGVLRNYDNDAIEKIFPNTTIGATTQNRVIQHPGTTRAGHLLSSRSIKLLFTPDDTDNHPMIIFYKALPLLDATAEINMAIPIELGIGVAFAGIRDVTNRVINIGFRQDISL